MAANVFVVDDHKLFRNGLIAILDKYEDINVVGEACNGEELLTKLRTVRPDVVLLDLNMPKMNGFETLDSLSKSHKDIKVIILSMYSAENYISKSIEKGACCYLNKNADAEEIAIAIESVVEKGFYFNDTTGKAMLHKMAKHKNVSPLFDDFDCHLNDTEKNVLKYLCTELTSSEIAKRMYLSPRTIDGVRQQLIKKLGVKNVVGLVLFAAKHGLVEV